MMRKIRTIKVPKPVPVDRSAGRKSASVREIKQARYDNTWRKFSEGYRKTHLFCVDCLKDGKYNSDDLHVDHIIPLEEAPELKYVESNLAVRCRSCHGKKTYRETLGKRKGLN